RSVGIRQENTPPELFFGMLGLTIVIAFGVFFPLSALVGSWITGALYKPGAMHGADLAWAAQFARKVLRQFARFAIITSILFTAFMAWSVRTFPPDSVFWALLSIVGGLLSFLLVIALIMVSISRYLELLAQKAA